MQKITPFLWFDGKAEEVAKFYVSLFKNSKIIYTSPMVVKFSLDGVEYMALNGGPMYKFTEAFSLYIECKDQKEVDNYWEKLSEGGSKGQCGWLKDRYGLSWQVIPERLPELMMSDDEAKSKRVMDEMLKMSKIDIEALERAYNKNE